MLRYSRASIGAVALTVATATSATASATCYASQLQYPRTAEKVSRSIVFGCSPAGWQTGGRRRDGGTSTTVSKARRANQFAPATVTGQAAWGSTCCLVDSGSIRLSHWYY